MHAATFTAETITAARLVDRLPQLPRMAAAHIVFFSILAFVGGVSVYDGYLVVRTGDMIRQFERNPVGVYLIDCNQGDPTLFLTAKGVGTSVVLAALTVLYRRRRRIAFPVAAALLVFQSGLLIFLERA